MTEATLIDTGVPLITLPLVAPEDLSLGTILSVSPVEEDHQALERIVSIRFTLRRASTLPSALAVLAPPGIGGDL